MNTMTNRVLKAELFLLFLLTTLSLAAFYYGDDLPDNYLSISSKNASVSGFTYLISSFITGAGYYLGPWTLFPFLCFALFYTLQFSKRNIPLDSLNFISLSGGCMFLFFVFAPEFLGKGLRYLIFKNFSFLESCIIGSIFIFAFVAGSFRSAFKEGALSFFIFLGKLPGIFYRNLWRLNPVRILRNISNGQKQLVGKVKVMVPSFLQGGSSEERAKPKRSSLSFPQFPKMKKSTDLTAEPQGVANYTAIDKGHSDSSEGGSLSNSSYGERDEQSLDERTPLSKPFEAKSDPNSDKVKNYKLKNEVAKERKYYDIVTTLTDTKGVRSQRHPDDEYFANIINSIQGTLEEFKIEGKIVNILKGPVVDTFELELGAGVKISKVTNAENEISMALLGAPIRIVYPMVGRTTVGIEVPRNPREIIYLDEVLSTKEFKNTEKPLPISMGKDAFGESLVVDLASMPHMLVAGATGAGKSVFINTLLVSLLVKKSPSQMKLILIDPKQLELALYSSLPHLVMPVVTDAKTAAISLLWACQEMERRYSILKELGVRNIEGFNEKLKRATPDILAKIHPFYENEPEEHYELPYLVIIVDEFADLILTKAGKDIENNICRLAAKARAAGIHLVLATQRPSVDVITGLIKSNFPTRVSFRVTSSQDSRTILNSMGAEKLLGKGDMLYRHGTNNQRVHSAYVDEEEIEALTDKLAAMPRNYHTGAMDFLDNGGDEERNEYSFGSHISGGAGEVSSEDDYFKQAVKTVVEHRTASASMLQRRLKIGYNRAANLIEEMEEKGIVGPAEGSKRRKVLWTSEDLSSQ